jgi:pimeloyl-ACP methyl ester carboxylesterase
MNTQSVYKTPAGEKAVMALYDAALERWPLPYETLTVPTRHGDTFVITSGDPAAPPLILLHGAGTNSAIWIGDVAEYSRFYRVYAVDLLGEAGKSAPNRPAWDSLAYSEWLADVFAALRINRAVLIGISQGSWTALKFAVTNPDCVEKLVLMTPGGIVPDRLSFILKVIPLSMLGRWGQRRIIRLLYGAQVVPDGVEDIMAVVSRHFKSRFGVLPIFSDEELQRLTMPVFLLGGTKDCLRDMEKIAARMRALLPSLTVKIIPGVGHAVLNTTDSILAFLRGNHV